MSLAPSLTAPSISPVKVGLIIRVSLREEVLGWDWMDVVHPEDRDRAVEKWRDISWRRGNRERANIRVRQANGEYRWFLARNAALRDEKGKHCQVVCRSWWISRTKKRTEARLLQALDEIKKLQDQLSKENIVLREEVDRTSMFEEIVGASPALKAVLARIDKVAPTDSIVFITGETGTGKELVARAIHKRSPRASRAFVSVNCAAIPAPLIASELFGHEKGAFTGAHQRRLGRFELAEGGTIFLDEIGELPMETQIALLRVLQDQEFERLGGNQPIRANARVITATNRDLQAAIEAGSFRSDLFYRLNVFPIEIPPLRERKEDIPILVEYFIHRYASKLGKKIRSASRKTMDLLQSYSWPGNIRELQNVIERSIIVCDTENFSVDENWLVRESCQAQPAGQPLSDMLVTQTKEMIEAALAESGGRVSGPSGAAARLGMPRLDSGIEDQIPQNQQISLQKIHLEAAPPASTHFSRTFANFRRITIKKFLAIPVISMTYDWHSHCILTKQVRDSRREPMTLKIQRSIKRDNAIFNLCGQIDVKELPELQRLLAAEEQKYVVLDLKEVKLIDREALRFLARCEENGIKLRIARHTYGNGF